MLAIEMMAQAMPENPTGALFADVRTCCVTRRETADWVPATDLFSDNFSDWDMVGDSGVVDRRVAEVLENGHLRWASWIWDPSGWRKCGRAEIAAIALKPPPAPWAAYAAEDMRRHGGLLTRVNFGADDFVQYDRSAVSCREARPWIALALEMRRAGFRAPDLSGMVAKRRPDLWSRWDDFSPLGMVAKRPDLWSRWDDFSARAKGSALLRFAVWCGSALLKEEKEHVGALQDSA